jgi:hypothetical protein
MRKWRLLGNNWLRCKGRGKKNKKRKEELRRSGQKKR